jgi:hypothetical protein
MTASFPHATKMLGISREDALAASFSPDALVRRALPSHPSAPVPRPPSATQPTPGGETKRAPLSATVMAAASASDIVGVPTTLPINQVGASPGSTANPRPICSIRCRFIFFLLSGGGFQRWRPGGGLRGVRDLPRQDRAPGDGPCQGMRPRVLVRFRDSPTLQHHFVLVITV